MNAYDRNTALDVKGLRQKYAERLEPCINDLKNFFGFSRAGTSDRKSKNEILHIAHRLSGSGATYGFEKISEAARSLEQSLLQSPLPSETILSAQAQALVEACVKALKLISMEKDRDANGDANESVVFIDETLPEILCVDDDKAIQALLIQLFENQARVTVAKSGQDALAIIKKSPPDVVILDNNTPVLNGLEFLRVLDRNDLKRHFSVVVLSTTQMDVGTIKAHKFHKIRRRGLHRQTIRSRSFSKPDFGTNRPAPTEDHGGR